MTDQRMLPDDPLTFIKRSVADGRILWTYHVNMRLASRHVPREAILESCESYEIIESYPADKYLPSYLVHSEHHGAMFHALFAVDVEHQNVRIVTAYWPRRDEWSEDLKRRRQL